MYVDMCILFREHDTYHVAKMIVKLVLLKAKYHKPLLHIGKVLVM